MPDNGNGAQAPEPVAAPVQIVLAFAGPDSTNVTIRAEHVAPGQLFLAAWLLDALAHEVRAGQVTQAALGGIVHAPGDALAQLRRAGRI